MNPKIKIIGIGGGGSNIVSSMDGKINGVELFIVDTNLNSLNKHQIKNKLHIGKSTTSGLGAGSKPEIGKKAFEEDKQHITDLLKDTDMVILVAGLGGGTGTGVIPEIANLSKELDILTLAFVTKPFDFEGKIRESIAEKGIKNLESKVNSYILIDNNRISQMAKNNLTFLQAFRLVDEFVVKVIKEITDLIFTPAFINLDFADLKTTLENGGKSFIGVGYGKGQSKIEDVVKSAISSPLLETNDIANARNIMLNMEISPEISYEDISNIVSKIKDFTNKKSHVIFGAMLNEDLEDEIKLTLIASNFKNQEEESLTKKVRDTIISKEISIYDYLDIPAYLRKEN